MSRGEIGLVHPYCVSSFNKNLDRGVRVQLVGIYVVGEKH
jgi:hypothetical protein